MAVRQSKSRSTNRDRCDGEPEQLYQRVIRRKWDLGRIGFAGPRHHKCCHRLQEQVLARTRRPLLSVFRQSCGSSDIGLLIEQQVVITKVRLVHLSVKIHLPPNKASLSCNARKPSGLRENGRLPVTLVMCQLCEFFLGVPDKDMVMVFAPRPMLLGFVVFSATKSMTMSGRWI